MQTKPTTKTKKIVKVRDMRAKGDVKAGKAADKNIISRGPGSQHNETLVSG